MRKKNLYSWLSVVVLLCLFNLFALMAHAADDDEIAMGFSVAPTFGNTQIDPELGYYYLKTKPGEPQKIELKLSSQQDDPIKVKLYVEDAYTGINGAMLYGINGVDEMVQDPSLTNPTSELVKPDVEVIELEGREEKVVSYTITPPAEHYEGIKLGQLVFQIVDEEENEAGLVDEYRYAMTILLAESGDEYDDGNEFILNEVKPTIKRGKRLVTANFQNPFPKRIVGLEMLGTITEKGKQTPVKEKKMTDFQFAPNSNVDFEMDWGLADLKAGEYTFKLTAKNAYDEFDFKKDFRISGEQATALNKESAFKIITPTWVKIVTIVNGVIVVIVALIVVKRNKKWQALTKRRKSQKKNRKSSKKKKTSH